MDSWSIHLPSTVLGQDEAHLNAYFAVHDGAAEYGLGISSFLQDGGLFQEIVGSEFYGEGQYEEAIKDGYNRANIALADCEYIGVWSDFWTKY